ncbi:MAG: SMC-Scp complex subunit ScpB [Sedimentisphaerales bacterium]|nr:SMC-Scp complex subunit ScpB [Sedimentisphaerales bacterium]
MTDKQDIINEEKQEAEEQLQVQDNNEDSEIAEESIEVDVEESDQSDLSDVSDESDISEEVEDSETSDISEEPEASDVSDESEESDQSEESELPVILEDGTTLESVIEAVLFASDESLTPVRLANITESTTTQVREFIKNLNDKYESNHNAFRIEQIAGGFQMLTLSKYNHWLKKLLRARSETKLSPAAMETLAIIAYKQPVIRADIEAIRGVAVGEVIRSLSLKGLVKIVGRAEILGRPMLYGTTKKFLEVFGLNTLKDLPKIEELKKPPS